MSDGYLTAIFVSFTFGALFIRSTYKRRKRVREVTDTGRSKIASAPQGMVEVEGFAWAQGDTFITPSRNEAIYYTFKLQREETRGSGKSRKKVWVTVFTKDHIVPFYLVDPTGIAMIVPFDCEVDTESEKTRLWSVLKTDEQKIIQEEIVGSLPGFPPARGLFGIFSSRYRIVESQILNGSPMYAIGDFKTQSTAHETIQSAGLTAFASRVMDLEGRSVKNLNSFLDKDRDGKVTETEAGHGYAVAAKISRAKAKIENQIEKEFNVYGTLATTENRSLFFADTHEKHLTERLKKWNNLRLVAGVAFMTCGIILTTRIFLSDYEIEKMMAPQAAPIANTYNKAATAQALHYSCINKDISSCRELVAHKKNYQLTAEQTTYYLRMICENGNAEMCQAIEREAASVK